MRIDVGVLSVSITPVTALQDHHNIMTNTSAPVEVWQIPTAGKEDELDFLSGYLSPEEKARVKGIHSNEKRHTFITSHAVMRIVLGKFIKEIPQQIHIQTDSQGKPVLERNRGIYFNLSHTHAFSLLAVSAHNNIGVDVETIKPGRDFLSIAKRFFSTSEYEWLLDLAREELPEYFYQLWCFKEAYLKGTGKGLQGGLDSLSLPKGMLQHDLPVRPFADRPWHIIPVVISGRYKAALAIEGKPPVVNQHYWNCQDYNPD